MVMKCVVTKCLNVRYRRTMEREFAVLYHEPTMSELMLFFFFHKSDDMKCIVL